MGAIIDFLNGIIWGPWFIWSFLAVGLYFSVRTKFLQVRLLKPMVNLLFKMDKSDKGISSFQALCTALAGRVGTGNIAGVATAIFWGGPGALFWMWLSAFLGASTAYLESALAQLYKIELDGQYRGGPAYYILYGMKNKAFAMFFSISALIACGIFLPGIQANAIASAFYNGLSVPKLVSGIVIAIVLGLIIFGGIKRIAAAAELIVPFMCIIYIVMAIIIIIVNISRLPEVLGLIFSSAFGVHAIFGGLLGTAVSWGVKRGIYSNEAGQGSQPHAAAAAEVSHPAKQGLVQAFSVYIDTLFVCSATGFMILMTGMYNVDGLVSNLPQFLESGPGPEYTQAAVNTLFPSFGAVFVAICLAFFAFTTIMSYYYQAEANIAYVFRERQSGLRKTVTFCLRLFMIVMVIVGVTLTSGKAWDLGDVGVGLMAWINVIAVLILQNKGLLTLKDYEKQVKEGKDPIFDPADYPELDNIGTWKGIAADYRAKASK